LEREALLQAAAVRSAFQAESAPVCGALFERPFGAVRLRHLNDAPPGFQHGIKQEAGDVGQDNGEKKAATPQRLSKGSTNGIAIAHGRSEPA
jgi:hypothetical protein